MTRPTEPLDPQDSTAEPLRLTRPPVDRAVNRSTLIMPGCEGTDQTEQKLLVTDAGHGPVTLPHTMRSNKRGKPTVNKPSRAGTTRRRATLPNLTRPRHTQLQVSLPGNLPTTIRRLLSGTGQMRDTAIQQPGRHRDAFRDSGIPGRRAGTGLRPDLACQAVPNGHRPICSHRTPVKAFICGRITHALEAAA